jgi:hypothetical protein
MGVVKTKRFYFEWRLEMGKINNEVLEIYRERLKRAEAIAKDLGGDK